jgi:hypothetical protein
MNRVELIGNVSIAPWQYLVDITMFEIETSSEDVLGSYRFTTHNILSPKKFEDVVNTLEVGDTVHIRGSLMYFEYMNNGSGAYKVVIQSIIKL